MSARDLLIGAINEFNHGNTYSLAVILTVIIDNAMAFSQKDKYNELYDILDQIDEQKLNNSLGIPKNIFIDGLTGENKAYLINILNKLNGVDLTVQQIKTLEDHNIEEMKAKEIQLEEYMQSFNKTLFEIQNEIIGIAPTILNAQNTNTPIPKNNTFQSFMNKQVLPAQEEFK